MKFQKFTLYNVMSGRICTPSGYQNCQIELTETQKESFVDIFGIGTSATAKNKLRSFINEPRSYPTDSLYERVYFEEDCCYYVPAQHYAEELRTIRKLICK